MRSKAAARAGLDVSGQFLAFEPGLYAVEVLPGRWTDTDVGLRLPCVRLEPLPGTPGSGRAFVSGTPEGGWLSCGTAAFVLVAGGQARVMLTVYKAGVGMASPELRIRPLGAAGLAAAGDLVTAGDLAAAGGLAAARGLDAAGERGMAPGEPGGQEPFPPAPVAPTPMAAPARTGPAAASGMAGSGVVLMAHVQGVGDVFAGAAGWAGQAGSRAPVEGFSVMPDAAGAGEIEYQAILGDQWNTPWTRGGGFCGSRGMALPILGFRVRLTGGAAERLECRYWGAFVGRGEVGPLQDGAACKADQAFLEAVRIVISPRARPAGGHPASPDEAVPRAEPSRRVPS